jgi:ABC-2 type transport system permease protein
MNMGTIWTIAKREFGAYFKSPIAYIVLSLFGMSTTIFALFLSPFFQANTATMDGYFGSLQFVLWWICPAVTMRLLAEERGTGTIEMLLTMPVRDSEVVVGKYLAALMVMTCGLLLSVPLMLTVMSLGPLDVGAALAGYLGAFLLCATYLALGLLASTLTRNQIVAYLVAFFVGLLLFALGFVYTHAGPVVGPVLQYLSPNMQFQKISRGVIELRNIVYYLTAIGVLLILSVNVLESRKWRTT